MKQLKLKTAIVAIITNDINYSKRATVTLKTLTERILKAILYCEMSIQ